MNITNRGYMGDSIIKPIDRFSSHQFREDSPTTGDALKLKR